jgi:glycosyltransferase involved in cell wall biosynthesis
MSHHTTAVLHVARNPFTGPWSAMCDLAKQQALSAEFAGVALGVIRDSEWSSKYETQLNRLRFPVFLWRTPRLPGTASFLYLFLRRPPLEQWAATLARQTGAESVVLHFHNAWMSGIYFPFKKPDALIIAPVVTFHGVNAEFHHQPVRRCIHRWMASRLVRNDAVLTIEDAANAVRARRILGLPSEKFTVIPNAVSKTAKVACPHLRGSPVLSVGHVGLLIPNKGWQITAEAVKRIKRAGHDVRLIIAGFGPDEPAVRAFSDENRAFTTFLGHVEGARDTVMPELDVMVLMSVQEGLPVSIVEALSVGLPVVATAVGGIPEIIRDGVEGLLVPRSVADLTHALERLLTEQGLLARLSANALQTFEERYEISKVAKEYSQVYDFALP